jgi:hypothetical protein
LCDAPGFRAGGSPTNFNAMKLSTFFALGSVVLALAGRAQAQGQDQFVYGISGGVMIPSGLGGDNHKLGPQGAAMVGIGSVDSPFGFRLDVMYGGLGSKTGTGTLGLGTAKVTNVSGNFLVRLIGQDERVYFVGGAGGYNYNPSGPQRATNDFAVNAGLGLWIPGLNGFVEGRWFNMYRALPDPATGLRGKKSLTIYPISIGLMF